MTADTILVSSLFIALLVTPILSPVIALAISRKDKSFQRKSFFSLVLFVGIVFAGAITGTSTSVYEFNVVVCALAYLAFCTVGISGFRLRLRPRALGAVLGGLVSLLVLLGLLFGTIGALGVVIIAGDLTPIYAAVVGDGKKCYVSSFGNATTSSNGYDVIMKDVLPVIPILEFTSVKVRFEEPNFTPADACKKASK